MSISQGIQKNYTVDGIVERVQQALEKAGLGSGPLQWSDLVPFDQFHVRGLDASRELAEALQLKAGQRVLDVGSGLGGPARYLAAVHGAHVTGIDLTPGYVEISDYLSRRAGLTEKLVFQQCDATELPFPDEAFDLVWTQHVAMNIHDKAKLYRGIHRVLKANGRLAIFDPIEGNGEPIIYPTPWANAESISFVAKESEMTDTLTEAGFQNIAVTDKTDIAAQWFGELQRQRTQQQQSQKAPNPLSPLSILGPAIGPAIANFAGNVLEGRIRVIQIIADKA